MSREIVACVTRQPARGERLGHLELRPDPLARDDPDEQPLRSAFARPACPEHRYADVLRRQPRQHGAHARMESQWIPLPVKSVASGPRRGSSASARARSSGSSLQLAAAELKKKVASLGIGIALFVVAAFLGVFALGFAFATIAVGLAISSTWLALLSSRPGCRCSPACSSCSASRELRKGTPLVPEQAIEEAKLTSEALLNGN